MTGLHNINMLAVSDNGHVFAGSTDGWVAYSTDGGASFTEIQVPVSYLLSDIQVVPDANYAANNIIYASGRTTISRYIRRSLALDHRPVHPVGADRYVDSRQDYGRADQRAEDRPRRHPLCAYGRIISTGRSGGMNRTLDPVYPVARTNGVGCGQPSRLRAPHRI